MSTALNGLAVVSRSRSQFAATLGLDFPHLEVVLDRRESERRRGSLGAFRERRKAERRRSDLQLQFQSVGFLLVWR